MKVSSVRKGKSTLGQVSDTDLRLLRVFKCVVECGGFSAAELELNIGTSAISKHMADLEARLGLTLCSRGRGGFSVTPEGRRIYDETLRVLSSLESFRSSVDDLHYRMAGQLEIAMLDKLVTNPNCRIADALRLFKDSAPDVAINIHVASTAAVEHGLLDGRFHVGICPDHRSSRSLVYRNLFEEKMLLYCGRGHPLYENAPDDLSWPKLREYAFAGLGYHSLNMDLSHRAQLPRKATAFDQEGIAMLVLSGRFLGFLPDHYGQTFESTGVMRAVLPGLFSYCGRFVSAVRRSPEPSRAALLFADCLSAAHKSNDVRQTTPTA